jgi:hypothetical protein
VDVLDGEFHHIAGTWESGTMRLYVDGMLMGTASNPTPANNARDLYIGYAWGGGTPQRFFRGIVDEAQVFDRALSPSEIQAIFLAGSAGQCAPSAPDTDGDGTPDLDDNCPTAANPDQEDLDNDGQGDACDADDDGDGVNDGQDNCPAVPNSDQSDTDADFEGDACDADDDSDTVPDVSDNCPLHANADQQDFDQDGEGDDCDLDDDGDNVGDAQDRCLSTASGVIVNPDGCSIDDLCPCVLLPPAVWKNHGAYVSCVARQAERFEELGLIESVDLYVAPRAQSDCGKRP